MASKTDLMRKTYDRLDGVYLGDIKLIVNTFWDCLEETLLDGEDVRLSGFGTLHICQRKSRSCVHPATGETIMSKPYKAIRFKMSAKFRQLLNSRLGSDFDIDDSDDEGADDDE